MNNQLSLEDISNYIISHNLMSDDLGRLSNLTTDLETSEQSDLVFYKLYENNESKKNLLKRLEKSRPGIVAVTGYVKELENYKYIVVKDNCFFNIQKYFSDSLFPYDEHNMKLVAVTGTNGKTSVVNICTQIMNQKGLSSFSIGTIGVLDSDGQRLMDTQLTTPSYIELRKIIYKFSKKYDVCFMELSSHALVQCRLHDLRLDVCAWTSFSRDHLDFHSSMEEYFEAKALIITKYLKKEGKVVIPNEQKILLSRVNSISKQVYETSSLTHKLPLEFKVHYNKQNLEVAIALCNLVEPSSSDISLDFSLLKLPKGRFSIIEYCDSLVVIDYSHTPDALENICCAITNTFSEYSLTVIFGCGGDRDPGKRSLMSKAILPYAKKIIITSDNPRFEDPEAIIEDIITGIPSGKKFMKILKRDQAIKYSLEHLNTKEVILIAGKGHEEYQDIKGVKHPFSDFNIVNKYIENNR